MRRGLERVAIWTSPVETIIDVTGQRNMNIAKKWNRQWQVQSPFHSWRSTLTPLACCSCCDRVTVSYVERWNRIRRSYENPSVMSPAGACNSVAPRYLYCPERTCAVFWLSHPYSAPLSIVLMWLMLSIVDYKLRNISTETAVIWERSRAGIIALSRLSLLKSRWKTDLVILSDNVLLVK